MGGPTQPGELDSRPDWLEGCVGFVVESDAGLIGRVVELQRDADSGRPVALVVRGGLAGWRRRLVPADEVAGVLPSSDRIILNGSPTPIAEGRVSPSPAR
jgi:hypothetical protein